MFSFTGLLNIVCMNSPSDMKDIMSGIDLFFFPS